MGKRIRKLAGYVMVSLATLQSIAILVLWFLQPHLTGMQLFQAYWYIYLSVAAGYCMGMTALCSEDSE